MKPNPTEYFYWKLGLFFIFIFFMACNYFIQEQESTFFAEEINHLQKKLSLTDNKEILIVLDFINKAAETEPTFFIEKIEFKKAQREIIIIINSDTEALDKETIKLLTNFEPNWSVFKLNLKSNQTVFKRIF